MRSRRAALLALLALISSEPASAQPDPNSPICPPNPNWSTYPRMRFTVQAVPGSYPVLLAEGQIDDEMLPRLEEALRTFRGNEIWLRSSGGNAQVANRAGFLIHRNTLSTRIPAGWACSSACAWMFIGGVVRSVDPGGQLIVQRLGDNPDPAAVRRQAAPDGDGMARTIENVAQESALRATEENNFLMAMGISRQLLTDIIYRQTGPGEAGRRCLTVEEMHRYNVVNDVYGGPRQAKQAP